VISFDHNVIILYQSRKIPLLKVMAPKNLLIVTHTFLPHVGGIERVVYEQGTRLMRLGFDVTVLTSKMNTPPRYSVGGVKVFCYDSLNAAFGLGIPYPVPQINCFEPFYKLINQASLVHVHGHPYLSSLYAAKLAVLLEKPVVLTQHNTFIEYESCLWDHVEWLNDATVGKQVIKNSDRVLTVSSATRRYVLSLGANPKRTKVLRNGVDVDRFKPLAIARDSVRKRLGIDREATVIVTVRRLVYKNGIDTLIESARIALKQNPELVFLAVGTGPDRDAVQTKIHQLGISGNFKLAGFVSDADLPAYYNAADMFVLPSKSGEGLPLVALEAMSTGLPVIATNVGGIGEIMMESCGRLVLADEPEQMADAILEFSKMGLSAVKSAVRLVAEQTFSWEENVKRLVETYEELI
jgi:glycosyltransferase involved in cell wall biosynthesis